MKKGFTLIELLAVIVILAIIALIAVPIVIHIIDDSKKSSEKESIKLYLDTVTKTIGRQNLKLKYEPDTCTIQDSGDLICKKNNEEIMIEGTNKILKIEMKGTTPTKGTLYFTNGKIISGENILYNDLYYQLNNGIISNGTKEPVEIILEVLSKIQGSAQNYTGTCEIKNITTMVCGNEIVTLSQLGHKVEEGIITFNNGEITSYKNLKMEGKYYHNNNGKKSETDTKQYLCIKVSDSDSSGTVTKGDKYACKVKSDMSIPYTFYILTGPSDGQVNMIMDRHICNDGTVNYTEQNNYCRYKWYTSNYNVYGPVTAMQELYSGTKDWDNVQDMIMNYIDENNSETDYGYTSIITNNGITTITAKDGVQNTTIGTSEKPLKARLPKYSEVNGAGCTGSNGSCPIWLVQYMKYWNGKNDKYSMNNNDEYYQKIEGYWLLASDQSKGGHASFIYYMGRISSTFSNTNRDYSIRPVITVPITDLLN